MEYRYDLCCSVPKYIVLLLVLIRCSVDGNRNYQIPEEGKCSKVTSVHNSDGGEDVEQKYCVRELTCIHYKDTINISWTPPQDKTNTTDILIYLTDVTNVKKVRINNKDYSTIVDKRITTETLSSTITSPRINITTDYSVDAKRRVKNSTTKVDIYVTSKACTKANRTNITSKATNNSVKAQDATISQTTNRQNTTKQLTKLFSKIDPDYSPATTSQGTSRLVKKHETSNLVSTSQTTYWQGANKHLTKAPDKNGLNNSSAESGALFIVIGLSVAGMVLLLVIVVIIVMLRRKKQSGDKIVIRKGKQKTDVEDNGPDEDDTYNHFSFDNQDGKAKRAKQKRNLQENEADEEGTYNHLSCDNQDRKTKIEKQNSQLQDNNADEESTYNHLSRDNEERKTKLAKQNSYLKKNEVDEEGTYSHMSRDCEETSTSMTQDIEEDTYNHLSLCQKTGKTEMMSGEINIISVSVHAPTTLESAGKNEEIQVTKEKRNEMDTVTGNDDTESAAGLKKLDSLVDDLKEPSRRKGPKGDLYTEIKMK